MSAYKLRWCSIRGPPAARTHIIDRMEDNMDFDVVRRYKNKDDKAADELIELLMPDVEYMLRRYGTAVEEHDELVSIGCEAVLRAALEYNSEQGVDFRDFVRMRLRCAYVNLRERKKRKARHFAFSLDEDLRGYDSDTMADRGPPDWESEFEEGVVLRITLNNLLVGLPDDCARIIKMYFYEYKKLSDISDATGLALVTVRKKLHKGLKIMKKLLQEKC